MWRGHEGRKNPSQIQPSERVVHWNTRRGDVCWAFLHRSSTISSCRILHVDVEAVELKRGPHAALHSWDPACLIPLPQNTTTNIDYTTTVSARGSPSGKSFFALQKPSHLIH
jgi:hypothetical protein